MDDNVGQANSGRAAKVLTSETAVKVIDAAQSCGRLGAWHETAADAGWLLPLTALGSELVLWSGQELGALAHL